MKYLTRALYGIIIACTLLVSQSLPVLALIETRSQTITAHVLPPPPTFKPVILQPTNGTVTSFPLAVIYGICDSGMLLRLTNNGELAGSVTCAVDGTFTANISLNLGLNSIIAQHFDIVNQPGPESDAIDIKYEPEIVDQNNQSQNEILIEPAELFNRENIIENLFEGTIFEPLAKLIGIQKTVNSSTNSSINLSVYIFVLILIAGAILFK